MKKKNSLLLWTCAAMILTVSAGMPSSADEASQPLQPGSVTAPETVSLRFAADLDYGANLAELHYLLENTGSTEAECLLDFVQTTSLDQAGSLKAPEITAISENDEVLAEYTEALSPLVSQTGTAIDTVTAADLRSMTVFEPQANDEEGLLCELSFEEGAEVTDLLTVTDLSGGGCRIYPLHCSYQLTGDGAYEVLPASGFEHCYVFIAGEEDSDFAVSEGSSVTLDASPSDLQSFYRLGCETYLEDYPMEKPVDAALLVKYLTSYVNASDAGISLDIIPSMQWMVRQPIYRIDSCRVVLQPGESVDLSVHVEKQLSPDSLTFRTGLMASGKAAQDFSIRAPLPESYTRGRLKNAKGTVITEKREGEATLLSVSFTDIPDEDFELILSKTPVWEKAYQYIVPMSIIMVVFLALCVVSYLGQRKKAGKEAGKKNN